MSRHEDETELDGPPEDPTEVDSCLSRAIGCKAALSWVKERHGTAGVEKVLARLHTEDRRLLASAKAFDWVPFLLHARLLESIDAVVGAGDLASLHAVGVGMARRELPVVGRMFMRIVSPGFFLDKVMRLWPILHSRGRWELTRGPGTVRGLLVDHPDHHPAFCAQTLGFAEGALTMTGAVEPRAVELTCAARGAPYCSYEMTWKELGSRRGPTDRIPKPPS